MAAVSQAQQPMKRLRGAGSQRQAAAAPAPPTRARLAADVTTFLSRPSGAWAKAAAGVAKASSTIESQRARAGQRAVGTGRRGALRLRGAAALGRAEGLGFGLGLEGVAAVVRARAAWTGREGRRAGCGCLALAGAPALGLPAGRTEAAAAASTGAAGLAGLRGWLRRSGRLLPTAHHGQAPSALPKTCRASFAHGWNPAEMSFERTWCHSSAVGRLSGRRWPSTKQRSKAWRMGRGRAA